MKFLKKIKQSLDEKIETDKSLKHKELSVKQIFDGRILTYMVKELLPLIVVLLVISIFYINNRYDYEATLKTNNELKDKKVDLQTIELIKMQKLKELSQRSAVLKKLSDMGSPITELQTPPIVIE